MAEYYAVWAQPVDNSTGAANVDKYGEIIKASELYGEGFSKDFCDGQTSPSPPRWPDDEMGLLWSYSEEGAQFLQAFIRGDLAERIAAGEVQQVPVWLNDYSAATPTQEQKADLFAVTRATVLPEELAETFTDGQLETRLHAYQRATGKLNPTAEEFAAWLRARYEETGEW